MNNFTTLFWSAKILLRGRTMLFDTHTHLNDEQYDDAYAEIRRMKENGVGGCIVIGCDRKSSLSSVEIADNSDHIYAAIGIHPQDAGQLSEDVIDEFISLSQDPKVVAIGEIGLDYHYENYPREKQKEVFIRQLRLADELGLPIVLHVRDAMGDCIELIKDNAKYIRHGGVVHSYSGSIESAKILMKYGLFFSFNGVITFKNASNVLEVVKQLPMDRILIETDCPYLTPVPYRGQMNRPENVRLVAEKIASIKGLSVEEVIDQTYANAKAVFKRIK